MNRTILTALGISLAVGWVSSVQAQVRSSANYSITTEVADSGGASASSASYSNLGSSGGVTGISSVASPAEVAKQGYVGQLYEVVGLNVTAPQIFVNEGTTLQLGVAQLLDDATTLALSANAVTWSVFSGPLASISLTGLATAQIVYQDTAPSHRRVFKRSQASSP